MDLIEVCSERSKVSVIIPAKNRAQLITDTINSLLAQTYKNWECIIIDDHSTDATVSILEQYAVDESRIKVFSREGTQHGAPICRNQGVERATGEYVIFLDSDDMLAPFCLEKRVQVMEEDSQLDFAVFPCQIFEYIPGDVDLLWNVDKNEVDLDRFLKLDVPWATAAPIWRQQSFKALGLWDIELLSFQDWELHLRAVIKQFNYVRISKRPDCFWRRPIGDSIGKKSTQPSHLYSHERLFLNVLDSLRDANILDEMRKRRIVGLFFWLSKMWMSQGDKNEAYRVWKVMNSKGLVSGVAYAEGYLYLSTYSLHPVNRLTYKYLKLRWSNGLLCEFSKTFLRVPASSLAG